MYGKLLKNINSRVYHQVVNCLGILVARPHDSLKLISCLYKLLYRIAKNITKYSTIVDDIQIHPISLSVNPDLKILMHEL
jgi:hypothetical protein